MLSYQPATSAVGKRHFSRNEIFDLVRFMAGNSRIDIGILYFGDCDIQFSRSLISEQTLVTFLSNDRNEFLHRHHITGLVICSLFEVYKHL